MNTEPKQITEKTQPVPGESVPEKTLHDTLANIERTLLSLDAQGSQALHNRSITSILDMLQD